MAPLPPPLRAPLFTAFGFVDGTRIRKIVMRNICDSVYRIHLISLIAVCRREPAKRNPLYETIS